MREAYNAQLEALATTLVNPERYGKVALVSSVAAEYSDLPGHAELYPHLAAEVKVIPYRRPDAENGV